MYIADQNRYKLMPYHRCGKWGLKLPALSLGLWHNFGGVDVFENGRAMCRRAFDLGITHFDLANNYGPPPGSAEENFGKMMQKTATSLTRLQLVMLRAKTITSAASLASMMETLKAHMQLET